MSASKWKPYPSYKESIERKSMQIPSHWEMIPNRHLMKLRNEKVGEDWSSTDLLSLTLQGIIPRDIDSGVGKYPASFETYQIVEKDDLVFCLFDIAETPRTIGISNYRGMITGAYDVLTCVEGVSPHYVHDYYLALDFIKGLEPYYTGLRKVVRTDNFNQMKTPIPPFNEQLEITKFIQHVDSLTTSLQTILKEKIKLLEEKRSALITQTVTIGLNPDVSMKDSEIDWIGQIPVHWEVKKLKHVTECLDSVRIPLNSEQRSEVPGDIPYYGATKQVDTVADWLFDETLVLLGEDGAPFFEPLKDVAYRIDGKSWVNNHAHVLRPKGIEATFLSHALNIVSYSSYIDGSTRDKLNQSKMKEIPVPFPPNEECRKIGERIREIESNLSGIIKSTQIMIETLVEYRTALISAAVTGKIDVRESV